MNVRRRDRQPKYVQDEDAYLRDLNKQVQQKKREKEELQLQEREELLQYYHGNEDKKRQNPMQQKLAQPVGMHPFLNQEVQSKKQG